MSKTAYLKSFLLMILLTFESMLLTIVLVNYVRAGDYFSYHATTFSNICLLFLIILYTYALTVGGWKKLEQYLLVPLPISVGIFVILLNINITYAILSSLLAFLFISYDITVVNSIKNQLIKFNPVLVLKYSTRGILFVFSLLAAVLVVISSDKNQDYNISGKVAEIANKQFKSYFDAKLNETQLPQSLLNDLTGQNLPFTLPGDLQSTQSTFPLVLPPLDLNIEETVKNEVESIISPYKHFIPSLIAILVFTLIRFLGSISNLIFNLTAWVVFYFAQKANFLHINYVMVKKEEIAFNKSEEIPNP